MPDIMRASQAECDEAGISKLRRLRRVVVSAQISLLVTLPMAMLLHYFLTPRGDAF